MKIAVIGGGSTYTPELIEGLILKEKALGLDRVVLQDIDPARLEPLTSFSQRMVSHAGASFRIDSTADLDEALDGADFVITQFRVGGQKARHRDVMLCLKHNLIGQETVGVGGFAKALRTIPAMMEVCYRIEKRAPKAWLINFTNPSGLITEAVLNETRVRAIGLCNVPMEMKMEAARALGVEPGDVRLDYVGLNHLGWVRRIFIKGVDVSGTVLAFLTSKETREPANAGSDVERDLLRTRKMRGPVNIPDISYEPSLLKALGMIPQFYLRYYYYPEKMLKVIKRAKKTRAQEVMEIEDKLMKIYRDKKNHEKPSLLGKRGGAYYSKAALELIEAILNDKKEEHIVNVQNNGATPDLPPDAVMEIPTIVGRTGASPLPVGQIEPQIIGLIRQVKEFERLTIRAGVKSDYNAALLALITNPLGPTAERAERVLRDIIRTNKLSLAAS